MGSQVDIWSLGVLVYTMLAGHFPFNADSMEALGKKVLRGRWDKPLRSSAAAVDLVQAMLVVAAPNRARIGQLCSHTWVLGGAASAKEVVPFEGDVAVRWDEDVGTQLERLGCPSTLLRHHLSQGAQNHVTAAYELLLLSSTGDAAGGGANGRPDG